MTSSELHIQNACFIRSHNYVAVELLLHWRAQCCEGERGTITLSAVGDKTDSH